MGTIEPYFRFNYFGRGTETIRVSCRLRRSSNSTKNKELALVTLKKLSSAINQRYKPNIFWGTSIELTRNYTWVFLRRFDPTATQTFLSSSCDLLLYFIIEIAIVNGKFIFDIWYTCFYNENLHYRANHTYLYNPDNYKE